VKASLLLTFGFAPQVYRIGCVYSNSADMVLAIDLSTGLTDTSQTGIDDDSNIFLLFRDFYGFLMHVSYF